MRQLDSSSELLSTALAARNLFGVLRPWGLILFACGVERYSLAIKAIENHPPASRQTIAGQAPLDGVTAGICEACAMNDVAYHGKQAAVEGGPLPFDPSCE